MRIQAALDFHKRLLRLWSALVGHRMFSWAKGKRHG